MIVNIVNSLVMCRKHLGHLIMVSLKYFFDLDPTFSSHLMLTALVIVGLVRLYAGKFSKGVHTALLDTWNDLSTIPTEVAALKVQWQQSNMRELIGNSVRSFRENLSGADFSNWKLK